MSVIHDRTAWLKAGDARCAVPPRHLENPYRLVLLGAPGVGKGTQAELLSERLGPCHLSTGDVFRAAKSLCDHDRSPALTSALEFMRRGDLVPDTTVLDLVRERMRCLRCTGGFLLDGFPRTVAQAEALEELLKESGLPLTAVVDFELPMEEVIARISGRRTCPNCKATFHITALPPRKEGVCDNCGTQLIQREDDRPESVRVRMEVYVKSTKPLIDFYALRNLLVPIPATGSPQEICERAVAALEQRQAGAIKEKL